MLDCLDATTHHESADHYRDVIFTGERFRVIVCRDGIQWIVQRRGPKTMAGARWRSHSYVTTRNALASVWQGHVGSELPCLHTLPLRLGGALV